MTIPTPTPRLQLTEDHYVADLANLFRRYRLRSGAPACLHDLGPELETNAALRGDLFNLCTAISHMGESDLSPEELLQLVARAAGGPRFASGELEIPSATRLIFLNLYEQWSARMWESMAPDSGDAEPVAPSESTEWHPPVGRFSAAAARAQEAPTSTPDLDHANAAGQSISPETRIGELTISQLRSYLDDIEHRVDKLKPYFAPIGRTGEAAVGLGVEAADALRPSEPAHITQVSDEARSVPPQAPAEELVCGTEEEPVPSSIQEETGDTASSIAVAEEVPVGTISDAHSEPDTTDSQNSEPVVHHIASAERLPVVLLPLRSVGGEAEQTMFRSVEDDVKTGSRVLPWLAAAVLLLGAGAGYEYRVTHRAHGVTAPEPAPAVAPAPDSDELARPESAPAPSPTAPPVSAVPVRQRAVPAKGLSDSRRHRGGASQPRLLPHEVHMEAQAARAGAAAANTSPGPGNEPR